MLARTIARYGRVDLLCIDELGYMELDRREGGVRWRR
jgi:DNA replication protein DnaC